MIKIWRIYRLLHLCSSYQTTITVYKFTRHATIKGNTSTLIIINVCILICYKLFTRLRMNFYCSLISHTSSRKIKSTIHPKHLCNTLLKFIYSRIFFINIVTYFCMHHVFKHGRSRFCNRIRT